MLMFSITNIFYVFKVSLFPLADVLNESDRLHQNDAIKTFVNKYCQLVVCVYVCICICEYVYTFVRVCVF